MHSRLAGLLCVFFLLFSLLPTGYEIANREKLRPERFFELVHNFPTDYNFYLSRIRQGIEGRKTVIEQYTSEPHEGSFIQVFYLFLGWLGKWWRVPEYRPADVYHVARVVFGLTLLILTWQFVKRAFSPTSYVLRLTSFLLAVTASTWPKLVFYNGGWRFGGFMPWWSVMDSLQRITFIPHLLAGQALMIGILLMLTNETAMRRGGSSLFVGILGFFLGIIFPPGLLFVYGVLGVYFVLSRKHFVPFAVFFFISLPALGYLQLMTTFYPWKRLVEVDIIRPLPFDYVEYFQAVGWVLPIGLLGLVLAFVKREKTMMLPVAWVAAWLLYLIAFRFVPQQSPLRFSEMIPHVPLAVLSAYLCIVLYRFQKSYVLRLISYVIPVALLIVGLGVMVSSFWWQRDFVDHKMRAAFPLVPTGSYVMYPLDDFISAMFYIHDTTPPDAVILSETTAGNYLPPIAGRIAFAGHDNTVKYEEKQALLKRFYSGGMKQDEAKAFLRNARAVLVFFGPQEKEDGGVVKLTSRYPFLAEVYTNTHVQIYAIR